MLTSAQAENICQPLYPCPPGARGRGQDLRSSQRRRNGDPTNAKLAGQANTLFKGRKRCAAYCNAYAFARDTMAVIARWLALAALLGAALLGLFVVLWI